MSETQHLRHTTKCSSARADLPLEWFQPPHSSSQTPFWFWNDDLDDAEIIRQIDDFSAHGIYNVIICARLGLPRTIPFLGERHLHHLRVAAEALSARGMTMLLLDEGMYASGSASGQIVEENPKLRGRGLVAIDLDADCANCVIHGVRVGEKGELALTEEQEEVACLTRRKNGHRITIINTPTAKACRGIHFREDDPDRRADHTLPEEEQPPAADLLNSESTEAFIRWVYDKVARHLKDFIGSSFRGFFTDQPSLVGGLPPEIMPGTWNIIDDVNRLLGYDFRPHLLSLWFPDEPDAEKHRRNYLAACQKRFDETFHQPLYDWCDKQQLLITGHVDTAWNLGHQRFLHIPGQDLTRNRVMPGKKPDLNYAAGCFEYSAMRHHGRSSCLNEYFGAYGHENQRLHLYRWLTNWLLVRGVNKLVPHAFFYSIRGPRLDECPPDVGLHSPWWPETKRFADACSRLSWLNTDNEHVCHVAILCRDDRVPDRALHALQAAQIDCTFLAEEHLRHGEVNLSEEGLRIQGMRYRVLIIEDECSPEIVAKIQVLESSRRIVQWPSHDALDRIRSLTPEPPFVIASNPAIRLRHIKKAGHDFFFFYNEAESETTCIIESGKVPDWLLDPENPAVTGRCPKTFIIPSGGIRVACSTEIQQKKENSKSNN